MTPQRWLASRAKGMKQPEKCPHCTGIVLFMLGRFSITRCTWGCDVIEFQWKYGSGLMRTFFELKVMA
jgi:hypothetical protein